MARLYGPTSNVPHRAVRAGRCESVGLRAWEHLSATRAQNASATVRFEVQGVAYRFTVQWDRLFGDATLRLFRVGRQAALKQQTVELDVNDTRAAKRALMEATRELFARCA